MVQVEHVKAERNVLAEVQNPFIVKLLYSFQVQTQRSCVHTQAVLGSKPLCQHYIPSSGHAHVSECRSMCMEQRPPVRGYQHPSHVQASSWGLLLVHSIASHLPGCSCV